MEEIKKILIWCSIAVIVLIGIFLIRTSYLLNLKPEWSAPDDFIDSKDIQLLKNADETKLLINLPKESKIIGIADTNSMIPTFDYGHTLIAVSCPCKIKEGDIISFDYEGMKIVHRVIAVDYKEGEMVYHTAGDYFDVYPKWIKNEQVDSKIIGILY